MEKGEQLELGNPADCKNPRKLTMEFTVDQDSKNWHWIYKTMMNNEFKNGVKCRLIRDGFMTDDVDDALIWAQNERARQDGE